MTACNMQMPAGTDHCHL